MLKKHPDPQSYLYPQSKASRRSTSPGFTHITCILTCRITKTMNYNKLLNQLFQLSHLETSIVCPSGKYIIFLMLSMFSTTMLN